MSLQEYVRRLDPAARRQERLRREFNKHGLHRVALDGLRLTEAGSGYLRYQPLYGLETDLFGDGKKARRDTHERWDMIEPHLPRKGSALDIGSQNGWFTFKLAQRGLFALGIESDERSVRISQLLALYHGGGRAAFIQANLDPDSAPHYPSVDVVFCLSVFHHLVRRHGLEHAQSAMAELARRCTKQMYFETGQSNEVKHKWAKKVSFMGDSPKQWITDFLLSLGFSDVTHIGDSPGHMGDSPRHLMLASK